MRRRQQIGSVKAGTVVETPETQIDKIKAMLIKMGMPDSDINRAVALGRAEISKNGYSSLFNKIIQSGIGTLTAEGGMVTRIQNLISIAAGNNAGAA